MEKTDDHEAVVGEVKKIVVDNSIASKASILKKNKPKKLKGLIKRHPLRAAVSTFLILVLVLVILVINKPKAIEPDLLGKPEDPAVVTARIDDAQKTGALRDQASSLIAAGSLAQADKLYDDSVIAESDTTKKIKLYLDLSDVYYVKSNFAKTIEAANKASALSEDQFLVADWLSRVYEDKGDYDQAAKYYTLAAQWATSPQNNTGISKAQYESEAARVRSLAQ